MLLAAASLAIGVSPAASASVAPRLAVNDTGWPADGSAIT